MNVICYRCGGGESPENTIFAIEHCQHINSNWPIEMDLQLTKDGEVVLFHDANTNRITGADYLVADLTLDEIKSLNAGFNFERDNEYPFRGQPVVIPTLKEVIMKFPAAKFVLDIHTEDVDIVDKVIGIVASSGLLEPVTIVSGYDQIIQHFKAKRPEWKYAAATYEAKKLIYSSFVYLDWMFPLMSDYLMIPQTYGRIKVLTPRVVNHVKKRNRAIWAWIHEGEDVKTVETNDQAQDLYELGVEAVFTDYPERLSLVAQDNQTKLDN